jgi:DUF1680 family protein
VNGSRVKPSIEKGYAVITRNWKPGDKVELELPMDVQRVRATDKIQYDRGKVALRYGPLLYNIEKVDQDITKPLSSSAPLTPEWKRDLLGGVVAVKGSFADGSPMMAIPNYARKNRDPEEPPPQRQAPEAVNAAVRRPRPPATSVVWINEQST